MIEASVNHLCGSLNEIAALVPKERPAYIGSLLEKDATVLVLKSDGGEFTVVINLPDGRSCVLASGWDWTAFKKGHGL